MQQTWKIKSILTFHSVIQTTDTDIHNIIDSPSHSWNLKNQLF